MYIESICNIRADSSETSGLDLTQTFFFKFRTFNSHWENKKSNVWRFEKQL